MATPLDSTPFAVTAKAESASRAGRGHKSLKSSSSPSPRESEVLHRLLRGICLGLACALAAGCVRFQAGSENAIVVPSPNHNARRPNFVILHDTTNNSVLPALKTLTDPAREVSSHYLVGRDGTLYQLVDEEQRAWHAGKSYWGGNTDLNSASIGIELDNTGAEPYPEAQMTVLLELLKSLKERYRIPANNFLGHGDVAPGRKIDPSRLFPWQHLAREGYGLWCPERALTPIPDSFDSLIALEGIGYDTSNPAAALAAFRRHFLGIDQEGEATAAERQLMQCLWVETRRKPAS